MHRTHNYTIRGQRERNFLQNKKPFKISLLRFKHIGQKKFKN